MTGTLLIALLLQADPPAAALFTNFLTPVAVEGVEPASSCIACHRLEGAQWAASRHHGSFDNSFFLNGFAAEPHPRCINCHAPLAEQAKDASHFRRELLTRRTAEGVPAASLLHEGITCVTCHLRKGRILAARPLDDPGVHPIQVDASLASSDFCAACHEFMGHETVDGKTVVTTAPMQTTWTEWKRWQATGGQATCQACHFQNGSHALRGAFDREVLKSSARVDWLGTARGQVAVVQSRGVGHRFPTGDVFRHLVLWADGVEVARFGKAFALEQRENGTVHQVLKSDSSLEPGVEVRVALPPGTRRLRLTYHYTEDALPRGSTLSRDETMVTLLELSR